MPANAKRGEVEITLGGEKRLFRLTAQACEEFRSLSGRSVLQAIGDMTGGVSRMDESDLFRLLYVGLRASDRELPGYDEWSAEMGLPDLMEFAEQLGGVIDTALGGGASKNAETGTATT